MRASALQFLGQRDCLSVVAVLRRSQSDCERGIEKVLRTHRRRFARTSICPGSRTSLLAHPDSSWRLYRETTPAFPPRTGRAAPPSNGRTYSAAAKPVLEAGRRSRQKSLEFWTTSSFPR